MAARRKSAYLAGLWEDTLIDNLLWYSDGSSIYKRPRPVPRAAPTWSWASIDRFISYSDEILLWDPEAPDWDYEREPYKNFAQVEECTVIPGGVDEFGSISQGKLRITGPVATGVLERETKVHKGRESVIHHVLFASGGKLPVKADYLFDEPGDDKVLRGAEIKCLQMSWMQSGRFEIFVSLVLRPVSSAPGVYERIGCVRIDMKASPSLEDPVESVYRSAVKQTVIIV